MPFQLLGLPNSFTATLHTQQYSSPTPIQQQAIPAILKGKDVLAIAPTGSGKTASYVLPILTNLQKNDVPKNRHVNVLVLVPTRELAVQVETVFKTFAKALPKPTKILAVYGGVSINPQMMGMRGVSVLIATPGRLLELITENAVQLSNVSTLVLDEADKMLNQGFKVELDAVLAVLPVRVQNLLFSATLTNDVNNITQLLLNNPLVIKIAPEENTIDLITQLAYTVPEEKKGPLLRHLIRSEEMKQVLIFTSSVAKCDSVADKLRKNGIDAQSINSKKNQGERTEVLSKFKAGKLQVLVATDLIARGIDIKFLPYVINYELPRSPKDYIHRIGRTGRAETAGHAISFVTTADEHHFKIIQKKMGKQVPMIDATTLTITK